MEPVSRFFLLWRLFGNGQGPTYVSRIPPDAEFEVKNLGIPNRRGETMFVSAVKVVRSDRKGRRSKQRVFVVCPKCSADIPFGRMHQHCGSKKCLERKANHETQR